MNKKKLNIILIAIFIIINIISYYIGSNPQILHLLGQDTSLAFLPSCFFFALFLIFNCIFLYLSSVENSIIMIFLLILHWSITLFEQFILFLPYGYRYIINTISIFTNMSWVNFNIPTQLSLTIIIKDTPESNIIYSISSTQIIKISICIFCILYLILLFIIKVLNKIKRPLY